MATPVTSGLKQVKPILSLTHIEARRKVITLYKTWYRQIPFIKANYILPVTKEECQQKLREEFYRHANVRDLRVIDMLLIKVRIIFSYSFYVYYNRYINKYVMVGANGTSGSLFSMETRCNIVALLERD
ncbi:NADH dehydrogenase [ubiquinone] 1 alpha subcomplex subunit 6 [Melipona quadrifasciata]|uniref:NADH dehydrogenase [ubiquinone] 1 alpha subcomplex subunit 6 n=1 Tax=Melipona quadrifasciata TaxID=166423 RepID=A0A0M8ZRC9_9HYME|nr:NADH dehydrogenase [ubiquinone] 1 alpha subcomplex subunit 6 [Melipona quadrifasciata]